MKFLVAGELNLDLILQNYLSFPALGQETLVEDITLTLGSSGAICGAGLAKLGNEVSWSSASRCMKPRGEVSHEIPGGRRAEPRPDPAELPFVPGLGPRNAR